VHKPLYGVLKAQGLIRASQKRFGLTSKGVEIARHLLDHAGETLKEVRNPERLTRDIEKELDRMLKTEAYRLFVDGHPAKILDTDFYAFFACTVRTSRSNFSTRLNAVENALEVACKLKKPDERSPNALAKLLDFLKQRFSKELSGKVANHVA
jgi:hypothetical protein